MNLLQKSRTVEISTNKFPMSTGCAQGIRSFIDHMQLVCVVTARDYIRSSDMFFFLLLKVSTNFGNETSLPFNSTMDFSTLLD